MAFEGRPGCPLGTVVSSATFRMARSLTCTRRIARTITILYNRTVREDHWVASLSSAP